MQATVSHPVYGLITYDEGFWTGKKIILFEGVPLNKINKTTYELPADGDTPAVTVTVKGSYIGGLSLIVGDEVITLTGKPSAADYVLGILPAVLFFIFIIQGAIGGGIAGAMGVCGVVLMKTRPSMKQKLLISLGASAAMIVIGVMLILAILFLL